MKDKNNIDKTLCKTKYFARSVFLKPSPPLVNYAVTLFVIANAINLLLLISNPRFATIGFIYMFNTIVLPVILILMGTVGIYLQRKSPDKSQRFKGGFVCIIIAIVFIAVRANCTYIEPQLLRIRKVSMTSDKITRPLRILHITDIQSNRIGAYEEKAFNKMRELNPDLILFTGDLLQTQPPAVVEDEIARIADLFRTLSPPLGLYGIGGDVDYRIANIPQDELGGIHMLKNESITIKHADSQINLLGIRCPESKFHQSPSIVITDWVNKIDPNDVSIIIGHAPDYAMPIQNLPIDLCLAGHTHGGQIRIPFFGPLVTFSNVPRKWARGFRPIGKTHLNVSAGIGSEHLDNIPSLRFNCPSEMTLIEILPATERR